VCFDAQDASAPNSTSKKRHEANEPKSVDANINKSDHATSGCEDATSVFEPTADVASSDLAKGNNNGTPLIGPEEVTILLGPHSINRKAWLNDVIINAAQSLLLQKYPNDTGLRDTIVVNAGYVHLDDPTKPFVQIFFDPANEHWITVGNRGCRPNTVRVYCSLMCRPSAKCRLIISQYVNLDSSRLTFQLMNVAKQRNAKDCGLYAIAFAKQLLGGNDPSPSIYKQDAMRQHLLDCLHNKDMSAFPISTFHTFRKAVYAEHTEELYCFCKGVSDGAMIQCDKCDVWFHVACLKLPPALVEIYEKMKSLQFTCDVCLMTKHQ
jgi:PHD-finger/Ulp1 protease family, C-terminal catalytic domain